MLTPNTYDKSYNYITYNGVDDSFFQKNYFINGNYYRKECTHRYDGIYNFFFSINIQTVQYDNTSVETGGFNILDNDLSIKSSIKFVRKTPTTRVLRFINNLGATTDLLDIPDGEMFYGIISFNNTLGSIDISYNCNNLNILEFNGLDSTYLGKEFKRTAIDTFSFITFRPEIVKPATILNAYDFNYSGIGERGLLNSYNYTTDNSQFKKFWEDLTPNYRNYNFDESKDFYILLNAKSKRSADVGTSLNSPHIQITDDNINNLFYLRIIRKDATKRQVVYSIGNGSNVFYKDIPDGIEYTTEFSITYSNGTIYIYYKDQTDGFISHLLYSTPYTFTTKIFLNYCVPYSITNLYYTVNYFQWANKMELSTPCDGITPNNYKEMININAIFLHTRELEEDRNEITAKRFHELTKRLT